MPYIGYEPAKKPLTSADISDNIITSSKIVDGNITSSKLADGAYNDENIRWDLATLALQQATDANKSAYSLPNSFIDQLEDSTGIDVQTNTSRNSNEYVSTFTESIGSSLTSFVSADMTVTVVGGGGNIGGQSQLWDGALNTQAGTSGTYMGMDSLGASQSTLSPSIYAQFAFNNIVKLYNVRLWSWNTNGRIADCKWTYSLDGSTWNYWNVNGSENCSGSSTATSNINWSNQNNWMQHIDQVGGTVLKYVRIAPVSAYNNANWNGGFSEANIQGYTYTIIANSSGNFTSTSKTAPATVSKMGIVVLYKNNSGTATLNTDLIAQVSADNGSNYSTVTLSPRGTFSTGINIASSSSVAVTPGTSCKYKISFANQSSGSKETQVHGVALLY